MQAHIRIVAVLYVALAALAVVAIDLRIVLIPAACASLVLVAAGFLVFRRLSGAISIHWPALKESTEPASVIVVEKTPLQFQGYDQELIVAVHARHLAELLACSVLAGVTLYFILFSSIFEGLAGAVRVGAYETELICAAGLAVLLLSLRWFAERLRLRKSHYTVGYLLGRDAGFFYRGVTYQFFDTNRERRGGHGPLPGVMQDNAVLVLFDPKDPDSNVAHSAFLFHRFAIFLIPARNRQQVHTLNSDTSPVSERQS